MAESKFKCEFCGKDSGMSRQAAGAQQSKTANPYGKETRKFRCEECARINDVERSAYDWKLIDMAARPK